jgi:hypothetical protein
LSGGFSLAVPAMAPHDFGMQLAKVSLVIYHLLKLAGIVKIAVFAVLIYQRMPLTYGEYTSLKANRSALKDIANNRMPVVGIPGTVKVDVTNDPLEVESDGQPIDVHVDDDPLPVTIER